MTEPLLVGVVVATGDSLRASVASALQQCRKPDHLVIVREGDDLSAPSTVDLPAACTVHHVPNSRTVGLAGALNTGIMQALGLCSSPPNTFIAIIDDASRSPDHLASCMEHVARHDVVVIGASGGLPSRGLLTAAANVHASGLFVRLSTILEAGLFDENLCSLQVHDLCLRLSDIGASFAPTETGKAPGPRFRGGSGYSPSPVQTPGPWGFWNKYRGRMTGPERELFWEQSSMRFGVGSPPPRLDAPVEPVVPTPTRCEPFDLVVGVISSAPDQLSRLLESFGLLQEHEGLVRITVLVLSNWGADAGVTDAIRNSTPPGVATRQIASSRYLLELERGCFGDWAAADDHLSIAQSRTILQKHLAVAMRDLPGSIGWVLDDDMVLDARSSALIPWLPQFREAGTDVLLGVYEGDSPNPGPNGLRVQLVDLLHNLESLSVLPPGAVLPDRCDENQALRKAYPDYYYDLSRKHRGHLESAFWIEREPAWGDAGSARAALTAASVGILAGVGVTRPLRSSVPSSPVVEMQQSVNRGGHTFIFSAETLSDVPNITIRLDARDARRSDMIWAVINRHHRGRSVQQTGFPIQHSRSLSSVAELSVTKVVGEVLGSALYAGLTDFFRGRAVHILEFSSEELQAISDATFAYRDQRLLLLRENWFRIRGLTRALARFNHAGELSELLKPLADWVCESTWEAIRVGCLGLTHHDTHRFLRSLKGRVTSFAQAEDP